MSDTMDDVGEVMEALDASKGTKGNIVLRCTRCNAQTRTCDFCGSDFKPGILVMCLQGKTAVKHFCDVDCLCDFFQAKQAVLKYSHE